MGEVSCGRHILFFFLCSLHNHLQVRKWFQLFHLYCFCQSQTKDWTSVKIIKCVTLAAHSVMFLQVKFYCALITVLISIILPLICSLREFSKFLGKAVSVAALGNSLSSNDSLSNRNQSRTSASGKQHSSVTVSTETQTSSGERFKTSWAYL